MTQQVGKLVIFSAPSGSGKTTLVRHLLASDLNLAFSISATSRAPRSNEQHGKDYYFLSKGEFEENIEKGAFLEWEEVYKDCYYGTLKSEVERIWKNGHHVIFDMDVIGGLNLKKRYGDRALAVFVKPPDLHELETRLRGRATDSESKILQRLEKAEREMAYADQFDHVLVNRDLDAAKLESTRLVTSFLKNHK